MGDIYDFMKVLNDIVDERFPNTTRYMIFAKLENYEETIEQFVKQRESI